MANGVGMISYLIWKAGFWFVEDKIFDRYSKGILCATASKMHIMADARRKVLTWTAFAVTVAGGTCQQISVMHAGTHQDSGAPGPA